MGGDGDDFLLQCILVLKNSHAYWVHLNMGSNNDEHA